MKRIYREWNELFLLPVALAIFFLAPYVIQLLDPGAGTYDSGVLQSVILATVALYVGKTVVWLALKIGSPGIYSTLNRFLLTNKNRITIWQSGIFSLLYFSILLLSWVLILQALT